MHRPRNWLKAFDGDSWQNLGSVDIARTREQPALSYLHGPQGVNRFFLAYVPALSEGDEDRSDRIRCEMCAGELTLNWDHEGNGPDHSLECNTGSPRCWRFRSMGGSG